MRLHGRCLLGFLDRVKRQSRKPVAPARKKRYPERYLAPVEEIVEQGLMVADVATRMSVKNEIILNALGRKEDYNEDTIMRMVKDSVLQLATERHKDAKHVSLVRGEISKKGSSSWKRNKYASDDSKTLKHRQEVYEQVAQLLKARAEDTEYLRLTAERARTAAWSEIGDSLKVKASHPYYSGGSSDEYKKERDERIQLLIQHDLTQLLSDHSHQKQPKRRLGRKSPTP